MKVTLKGIAAIVFILLLIIVTLVLFSHNQSSTKETQLGAVTYSWLQEEAQAWKPVQNTSVGWSAMFQSASYDYIETTSSSNIESELTMLFSSGASCIRIDVGYDAWLTPNTAIQNELANLTSQIRSAGKCLIIADASAEQYRAHPLPWSQFKDAWVQRVATLASAFHPDFYEVIKEPGWYYGMISDFHSNPTAFSASDWLNLTQWLTNTVVKNSPNTKVGVAVPANQLTQSFYSQWFNGSSRQPGISFIGFDDYAVSDYSETIAYLNQYGAGGKSVWIAEAGSTVGFPSDTSAQMTLDAYWIQVLYYFGVHIHASNLIPFWTDSFASYNQPANYTERTPLFYEYQYLATTFQGKVT